MGSDLNGIISGKIISNLNNCSEDTSGKKPLNPKFPTSDITSKISKVILLFLGFVYSPPCLLDYQTNGTDTVSRHSRCLRRIITRRRNPKGIRKCDTMLAKGPIATMECGILLATAISSPNSILWATNTEISILRGRKKSMQALMAERRTRN